MRITLSITWKLFAVIFVILGLILGGFSFASYTLYQKIQLTERAQKELARRQLEEKFMTDQQAARIIADQQKALTQSQTELSKAKQDAAIANQGIALTAKEVETLSRKLATESQKPQQIVMSSNDIAPYTTGVVQVICSVKDGVSSGSGSLWSFSDLPHAVITNKHVIKDATGCVVSITNSANQSTGIFKVKDVVYSFNQTTDSAILAIGDPLSSSSLPLANYNYSIPKLPACSSPFPVGSPMVIIGYPVYAKRDAQTTIEGIGTISAIYRTVTNGIISGYDTSQKGDANYFVSSKIDSGNSGGIAIAKDTKGLCILGLPTWLTVGTYETQGLVQNITNILPKR